MKDKFSGHYDDWTKKRIDFLLDILPFKDYNGITVLEVGAGFGIIGRHFAELGASVTFTDGRDSHLNEMCLRHGDIAVDIYKLDLMKKEDYPQKKFDLVLHCGVLYHLTDIDEAIKNITMVTGDTLILETEVIETKRKACLVMEEHGYDQSLHNISHRVSEQYIESLLRDNGFTFNRHDNDKLNSGVHSYNWVSKREEVFFKHGMRRLWIAKRE